MEALFDLIGYPVVTLSQVHVVVSGQAQINFHLFTVSNYAVVAWR